MAPVMRGLVRLLSLWGPVAAYMAAIYVVSAMPSAPLPPEVSDKVAHLAAYAGLGVLATRAAAGGLPRRLSIRSALVALVIASGHGALDEWHQSFVPGRSADIADWYADTAGVVLALGVCWAWGMIAARADG